MKFKRVLLAVDMMLISCLAMANTQPATSSDAGVWAAFISAASAFIAVSFSIWVYYQTRKLVLPTERPFISIDEMIFEDVTNPKADSIAWHKITFLFRNRGKHPADNISITLMSWGKSEPDTPLYLESMELENRLEAEGSFELPILTHCTLLENRFNPEGERYPAGNIIMLKIQYSDWVKKKNKYIDIYPLELRHGDKTLRRGTKQLKEKYLEVFEKEIIEMPKRHDEELKEIERQKKKWEELESEAM